MILLIAIANSEPTGASGQDLEAHDHPPTFGPMEVCPAPKEIMPCACYFMEGSSVMDCSKARFEDDLLEVFSRDLSVTSYGTLRINLNYGIKVIREGDLGTSTFRKLRIDLSRIVAIEDGALMGSRDTLTDISITESNLTYVPDLSYLNQLKRVEITGNNIVEFPHLESKSLIHLDLSVNNITDLPADALKGLPALESFEFVGTLIKEVQPGTFTTNDHLSSVILADNYLTTLPDNAVKLRGPETSLSLDNNKITHISYEAVSSVTGLLGLENNLMIELPEEVFRPLLERNVNVYAEGNPLGCGCDIAWLVTNKTLLHRLADFPRCADGKPLVELDSRFYEIMCK